MHSGYAWGIIILVICACIFAYIGAGSMFYYEGFGVIYAILAAGCLLSAIALMACGHLSVIRKLLESRHSEAVGDETTLPKEKQS